MLLLFRFVLVLAVLLGTVTWATLRVRPEFAGTAAQRPLVWLTMALVLLAIAGLVWGLTHKHAGLAFISSALLLVGFLASAAAAGWPVLLHSTVGAQFDLTAHTASSGSYALHAASIWAAIGLPPACAYFVYLARVFRGPVQVDPTP